MKKKFLTLAQALRAARQLKRRGKRLVFTNGTFDILHLGHVQYLQKARSLGDALFVGVNTDASVRSYKAPGRPVNGEKDRALVLAALECVDAAVLFNDPTPLALILKLKPDILAKGADWKKAQIAGAREVQSWGGKVKLIRLTKGRSTTGVIQKIVSGSVSHPERSVRQTARRIRPKRQRRKGSQRK